MNQRLSSLDQTMETLKIEKERQDQKMELRIKCKESQIKSLNQRIDVLVEAEGHMKMEIETLKQQILEKQKETCQVELSSNNDMEKIERSLVFNQSSRF